MARALAALDADLVCVQEAPRLLLWRLSRLRLAHRAGLRPLTRARAGGNLLLAWPRPRLRSAGADLLPRRPGLHRRAVVHAEVEVDGRLLVLAGTHLDVEPAARLDSAARVRALLPRGPLVLGADVNDVPGSPAWQVLSAGLVDARAGLGPTFPAARPDRCLDALIVDPALEVVDAAVGATGRVSDHLPVRADLRWR